MSPIILDCVMSAGFRCCLGQPNRMAEVISQPERACNGCKTCEAMLEKALVAPVALERVQEALRWCCDDCARKTSDGSCDSCSRWCSFAGLQAAAVVGNNSMLESLLKMDCHHEAEVWPKLPSPMALAVKFDRVDVLQTLLRSKHTVRGGTTMRTCARATVMLWS